LGVTQWLGLTRSEEPGDPPDDSVDGWAGQTRRVLTRDLLVRASHAYRGEARALQFRALHLNLPLVGEIADRMHLGADDRSRVEHDALDGLLDAVRLFDPYGEREFSDFAVPFIERRIRAHLRTAAWFSPRTGRPSPR